MPFTLVMLPPQTAQSRDWATRLSNDAPAVDVVIADDEDVAIGALIAGAQAALGILSRRMLENAPSLRWLQVPQAGPPEGFYFDELVEHPVVATNFRGTYTEQLATHTVALVLALARGLEGYVRNQVRHEWVPQTEPDSVLHLSDATILVVGLGAIGREVARLLAPFGCRIVATDAREEVRPPHVHELYAANALDRLIPSADVVILTVPLTPATNGLFNRRRIATMKSSALIVNVGRGQVVDIDAVAAAIQAGRLGGAGMDVFSTEPLPSSHALWDLPRVIITPHVAIVGRYRDEQRYAILLENARRFAAGEVLLNVVDKANWF